MKFSSKFALKVAALLVFSSFTTSLLPLNVHAEEVKNVTKKAETVAKAPITYITVEPLDVVANPQNYLNKNVKMQAVFHKFSMLGLDYDKAKRDSKDHISMLIKRPGVAGSYTIPLSEMKIIIKRDLAEKLSDLESGDRIELTGKVFSTALKDPWIDVIDIKNLDPQKKETPKE